MWLFFGILSFILLTGIIFDRSVKIKSPQKKYIMMNFFVFTLLSAFRAENVGNDTNEYIRIFNNIALSGDISNFTWRFEIGYLYLNEFSALLSSNSQIIIIITSIIIMVGFARFIHLHSEQTLNRLH